MPKAFINRRDEAYYIKSKLTKTGKVSYYMTKVPDDTCLGRVPEGCEVFEKPDSGVCFIRKIKPSLFNAADIKIIENELRQNESLAGFRLDVHGNLIKIYTAERAFGTDEPSILDGLFKMLHAGGAERFRRYEERMRLEVRGTPQVRMFKVMRYCYRGSIDDWIDIGRGQDLALLAAEMLPHLGKESYYELFYWG